MAIPVEKGVNNMLVTENEACSLSQPLLGLNLLILTLGRYYVVVCEKFGGYEILRGQAIDYERVRKRRT